MQNIDPTKVIQDLLKKQETELQRISRAQAQLELIQAQLEIAEKYIELVNDTYDAELPIPSRSSSEDFSGLSIKECLVRIARSNKGFLDLSSAKRKLVAAGIFKDDRNASTSIGSTLSRNSDLFKNIARGVYKLVGVDSEPSPQPVTPVDVFEQFEEQESSASDDDSEPEGDGEFEEDEESNPDEAFAPFAPAQPPVKTAKDLDEEDELDKIFSSEDEIPF